jgi:hypothetical protein
MRIHAESANVHWLLFENQPYRFLLEATLLPESLRSAPGYALSVPLFFLLICLFAPGKLPLLNLVATFLYCGRSLRKCTNDRAKKSTLSVSRTAEGLAAIGSLLLVGGRAIASFKSRFLGELFRNR